MVISSLTLKPTSARGLLETIWSEWRAFRDWTQKSVNHLRGTQQNSILSPTPAAAAWAGVALLLLVGIRLTTKTPQGVAYSAAILIPWVALDLLWQANLSTQLEETRHLFAGRSQHDKHLADRDRLLYEYTDYLKREVLPEPGARIFLLHDSKQETYERLKAQYYLLPHNIYNYDRFPKKQFTRTGDYVLELADIDGLDYHPAKSTLNWRKKSLPVKLIDTHPTGNLYRVVARNK